MNWFNVDITPPTDADGQDIVEVKDIDMITKLLYNIVYIVDDKMYHKLAFADEEKRVYFAEYTGPASHFEEGDVVKLRSVSLFLSQENNTIQFKNYSRILALQSASLDAKTVNTATKGVKVAKGEGENHDLQHLEKMDKVQIGLNTFAFNPADGGNTTGRRSAVISGMPLLDNFECEDEDFEYENNFGFKFYSKRGSAVLKKYAGLEKLGISSTWRRWSGL